MALQARKDNSHVNQYFIFKFMRKVNLQSSPRGQLDKLGYRPERKVKCLGIVLHTRTCCLNMANSSCFCLAWALSSTKKSFYISERVDKLMSKHLRTQKRGWNLMHCSFSSEAQRTFVTLHLTISTSQKLLISVKE